MMNGKKELVWISDTGQSASGNHCDATFAGAFALPILTEFGDLPLH